MHTEPSASTRYADSIERDYASEIESLRRPMDDFVDEEVVLADDDDPDYEPYPRPYHESRQYPSYGRYYEDNDKLPSRPRVKGARVTHTVEQPYDSGYGTDEEGRYMTDVDPYQQYTNSTESLALERVFDRGGELVKWQEIVKDSAAAEAALAAAAAAAAQYKRLSELDGDSPGEGTPRVSEATLRASQRLKQALRARVARVAS